MIEQKIVSELKHRPFQITQSEGEKRVRHKLRKPMVFL
jgi:hypothetical protein